MLSPSEIQRVIDRYERVRDQRLPQIEAFMQRQRPFLVAVDHPCTFYNRCNSIEQAFAANLTDFAAALDLPSDSLPFLEPWFGTGAYAEAFGCVYHWREDVSPACHYAYHHIDEVRDLPAPSIDDSALMRMVLDAIALFRDRTHGKLPVCMTDTQSPHDTATLVLDAVEVFTASYSDPEILHGFLQVITDLIIAFSRRQQELLGDLCAAPGHIMMTSVPGGRGISISDDNLAVASPTVNERFLLPYNEQIGAAFDGVAIHSCGNFGHTMPALARMKHLIMLDCALPGCGDPNPNEPEIVRDAFRGTDIIVQVRAGAKPENVREMIDRVWADDLRLIVKVPGKLETAPALYHSLTADLNRRYGV